MLKDCWVPCIQYHVKSKDMITFKSMGGSPGELSEELVT